MLRRIFILIAIIGAWELLGRTTSRLFLAPFSEALVATADPGLLGAWTTSVQALAIGYGLASISAIGCGLLMGRFQVVEQAMNPYVTILLAVPMVALIPVFVIVFGISLAARVAIVFSFVFVYVAVNTLAGAKSVSSDLLEMARSFGLNEWQRFRWIILPGAAPMIMSGLRLGFGRAIMGMLLGEILLLAVGVGGKMLEASNRFDTAGVLAIVLTLLLFSWGGGSIIEMIDHRVNRWQRRGVY